MRGKRRRDGIEVSEDEGRVGKLLDMVRFLLSFLKWKDGLRLNIWRDWKVSKYF